MTDLATRLEIRRKHRLRARERAQARRARARRRVRRIRTMQISALVVSDRQQTATRRYVTALYAKGRDWHQQVVYSLAVGVDAQAFVNGEAPDVERAAQARELAEEFEFLGRRGRTPTVLVTEAQRDDYVLKALANSQSIGSADRDILNHYTDSEVATFLGTSTSRIASWRAELNNIADYDSGFDFPDAPPPTRNFGVPETVDARSRSR